MANRFWRMPVAPEMNSFQSEICGHQAIASGDLAQDRAVISDSGESGAIGAASSPRDRTACHPADFGYKPFLREWHDKTLYRMLPIHSLDKDLG